MPPSSERDDLRVRVEGAVASGDPEEAWGLLLEVARAITDVGTAGADREALESARVDLHVAIEDAREGSDRLRARASQALEALRAVAHDVMDDPDRSRADVADALLWVGAELEWLRDLVERAVEDAPVDRLPRLRNQLGTVTAEVRRLPGTLDADPGSAEAGEGPDDDLDERLEALRARVLSLEVDRFLRRTASLVADGGSPPPPDRARPLHRAIVEATELREEVRTVRDEARSGEWARELVERGEGLRERLEACIEAAPADRVVDDLLLMAEDARDRAHDALAEAENAEPEEGHRILEEAAGEARRVRGLVQTALSADPAPEGADARRLKGARWRLVRSARRAEAELQERRLQGRLEGLFGFRAVQVLENLILILILGVCVLLGIEFFVDLSPEMRFTFAVADGVICAIFLAEFGLKLALTDHRAWYFYRHALIDFIPSIPFGLLLMPAGGGLGRSLDWARSGRLLRLLRLTRLVRYIRVLRPLIRLFRVFTFALRGLDRVVQRKADLLNRGVVFFEPTGEETHGLVDRVEDLEEKLHRRADRAVGDVDPEEARPILEARLATLEAVAGRVESAREDEGVDLGARDARERRDVIEGREVRFADLVESFERAEARDVEVLLEEEGAHRLHDVLARLDAPVVRSLPIVREVLAAARRDGGTETSTSEEDRPAPAEVVARACRATGRMMRRGLDVVLWFADFHGTVTAPQLLDRVGMAMVKTTARPAKRLIILGAAFLLIQLLIGLFGGEIFQSASNFIYRSLGLPIIALGVICAVIVGVGIWFRRMAGEATDFYERVADAQHLPLLEGLKDRTLRDDLTFLHRRVIVPERRVGTICTPTDGDGADDAGATEAFIRRIREDDAWTGRRETGRRPCSDGDGGRTWAGTVEDAIIRRVALLHRDYVDGAIFHENDTKTTCQLLGNLALENIRRARLELPPEERQRIEKLDLARASSLLGPYLWFNAICTALSHRVAKLVLDYNRHCIPLEEQALRDEGDDPVLARFREWLNRRRADALEADSTERETDAERFREVWAGNYTTTEFTALHFFDPAMEEEVEELFGSQVRDALVRDRQGMFRDVFGTYPFRRVPRPDRTLNPYALYQSYVAGGRVFLMPVWLAILGGRLLGFVLGRIRRAIREIRQPHLVSEDPRGRAGFEVAVRKIQRMRKPVALEAMWLRARFDVEYLGLDVPGQPRGGADTRVFDDLDEVGATPGERARFEELRERRRESLERLEPFLEEEGYLGPALVERLEAVGHPPDLAPAVLRALAMAFAVDHRGLRTLARVEEEVARWVERALAGEWEHPPGVLRRVGAWVRRPPREDREALERALEVLDEPPSASERRRLRRGMRLDPAGFGRAVRIAGDPDHVGRWREAARERLREIRRHPAAWTEELVILRTVQSMAILDIRNYRSLVRELGGYDRPARSSGEDVPSGGPDASADARDAARAT